MTLHVFYRAAPGGNRKARPEWFSKWLCLTSVLRCAQQDPTRFPLTFVCDGALDSAVMKTMEAHGRVLVLRGVGNSASYRHTLTAATDTRLAGADGIYLVEDDYLHLEDALVKLADAVAAGGGQTYCTPYDHPDRYRRTDDLAVPHPEPAPLGGHDWRQVESTNMTFATDVATLRSDQRVHRLATEISTYPHDRSLWRVLQGLGIRRPVAWLRGPRRVLGPVPSLATHAEAEHLAPGLDWNAAAEDIAAWSARAGLPPSPQW